MDIREKVITDYISNKLTGVSYTDIEKMYSIEHSSKKGDKVRGWINWYKNVGINLNEYAPGLKLSKYNSPFLSWKDPRNIKHFKDSNTSTKKIDSIKSSVDKKLNNEKLNKLLLKSRWQIQKKGGDIDWLESYTNNVDPSEFKKFFKDLFIDIPSPIKTYVSKKQTNYDKLLVISLPDFHIGREQLLENNNKYLESIQYLIQKVSHECIGEIVFVIGNDYFNSDVDYKTTKGTPQFDYQKWKETWNVGRDLLISAIDFLKEKKVKVNIINIPGNHDVLRMSFLGEYLEAYYRNDSQVLVDNSDKILKCFKYGDVLLAFEHGEYKRDEYESILATEFPELWGSTKYREVLCGHLHAETVKEFRGMKLRHLPSLAKESDWEIKQGYKHKKEAQALVYSKNKLESIYIE